MNLSANVSTHFHQVLFGGNWTWANLEETLADVSFEEAQGKVGELNSILSLVNHISYYFHIQLKVLQGGPLQGKDEDSWTVPAIASEYEWRQFVKDALETGALLSEAIKNLPEENWDAHFTDEKYGIYYRNLQGMIEHTHYHLGQITSIKKLIKAEDEY